MVRMATCFFLVAMGLAVSSTARAAEPSAKQVAFFESKIRPILAKHCYQCHSDRTKKLKAGLRLDTRQGWVKGGKSGSPIVAGKPKDSLLFKAVSHSSRNLRMPPKGKLPESAIRAIEQWIAMGAPDPRTPAATSNDSPKKLAASESDLDLSKARQFWAFQPVQQPSIPSVRDNAWPRSDIDRFILARIEKDKLTPVGDADRQTLLRRVTFDLIGLPPTLEEIKAFVNDPSPTPKAFEKVIDRLLASRQFGERWGRHWLDTVRYAESIGRTRNYPFPHAWRYRDYVIDSFNKDKPFNRFVREQLAGDLMPAETESQREEQLIATGYLALGSHDLNERDGAVFTMDVVDEQINVVGRSMMALTLGCARCHDHKFDPVPTADYYALAGIFKSTQMLNGYRNRGGGGNKGYGNKSMLHSVGGMSDEEAAAVRQHQAQLQAVNRQLAKLNRDIKGLRSKAKDKSITAAERRQAQQASRKMQGEIKKLQRKRTQFDDGPTGALAMGVRESPQPADARINIKGDAHDLGPAVPRGYVRVVHWTDDARIKSDGSGRAELADWMTAERNPLTARVWVNRVWHHLFGRGIVRTVDNFGEMGARPSHPELLDHLASRFVADGWSTKQLIRAIVLSRTYQLGNDHHAGNYEIDPDNVTLWRASRRRLEAEAIRDAMLRVSGNLKLEPRAGSPVAKAKNGELGRGGYSSEAVLNDPYRSVYAPIVRQFVPDMFTTFDFAEPSETKGARDVTTVAPQALFMMNSPFVISQSKAAAGKLVASTKDDRQRVERAYQTALGRTPTEAEAKRILAFIAGATSAAQDKKRGDSVQQQAWADVYHALLASVEFRYVQ